MGASSTDKAIKAAKSRQTLIMVSMRSLSSAFNRPICWKFRRSDEMKVKFAKAQGVLYPRGVAAQLARRLFSSTHFASKHEPLRSRINRRDW